MTRINVVPVAELCDKHLLAEYRELPRVFKLARPCPDAPKQYTLGAGHVKFFYDKIWWLENRWMALKGEMIARGFSANLTLGQMLPDNLWHRLVSDGLFNYYEPTPEALALNRARIAERISQFRRP